MILAIVLVLLMLFCAIAEFSRLWIIAQGVKEAAQQAVISTVNDNYDDVYHAVREGYAAGWYPDGTGRWDESIDTGDVYGQLSETLGLENTAGGYQKISDGEVEYTISDLSVVLENNSLGSGQSEGYTALVEIHLEVPVRFLGESFARCQHDFAHGGQICASLLIHPVFSIDFHRKMWYCPINKKNIQGRHTP